MICLLIGLLSIIFCVGSFWFFHNPRKNDIDKYDFVSEALMTKEDWGRRIQRREREKEKCYEGSSMRRKDIL